MNKNLLSDERLVSLHRQKRINAFFTLYARYKNYGYVIIQSYLSKNKKYSSLFEEKDIILCTSINESISLYDNNKGSFRCLLSKIIEHKTINIIKDYMKDPLYNCLSIDSVIKDSEETSLLDTLTFADQGYKPDERISINESKSNLNNQFSKRAILMMKMKEEGYSYEEIAKVFNMSVKATTSLFYRIRKKLSKDALEEIK